MTGEAQPYPGEPRGLPTPQSQATAPSPKSLSIRCFYSKKPESPLVVLYFSNLFLMKHKGEEDFPGICWLSLKSSTFRVETR